MHLFYTIKNIHTRLPWLSTGEESACQCRRHEFDPCSGKIPHAVEQLSSRAIAVELVFWSPESRNYRVLEPVPCSERGHCNWKLEHHSQRVAVAPHSLRTSQQQRPSTAKNNIISIS